jgi:hypothetical protein
VAALAPVLVLGTSMLGSVPSGASAAAPVWSGGTAPLPPNARGSASIVAAACPAPGDCVAVGSYNATSWYTYGVFEMLSGRTWSALEAPQPMNAGTEADQSEYSTITSVSCSSQTSCVAVGYYEDDAGPNKGYFHGLIETLSGGTWVAAPAPQPGNSGTDLDGDQNAKLEGISCVTPGACTAVGSYNDASGSSYGLIESLSGGNWTATEAPEPADAGNDGAGTQDATLTGVACSSTAFCALIGKYNDDVGTGDSYGLIETGSGSTWTPTAAPLPPGAGTDADPFHGSTLSAVTCSSDENCAVAGSYRTGTGPIVALVDELTSRVWGATVPPLPPGADLQVSILYGIACPADGACVAVGTYQDTKGAMWGLIDTVSAATWTAIQAPEPPGSGSVPGAVSNGLNAISCPSSGYCVAVGSFVTPTSGPQGLGETLSGATWAATPAALPPGAATDPYSESGFSAVGCAVSFCAAVGNYIDQGLLNINQAPPPPAPTPGYDLAGADGGVFVFPVGQSSGFFGSLPGLGVKVSNVVGIVPTNNFTGYDLVGSDGGVFVFPTGQSSGFFGSLPGLGVKVSNVVGIVPTNNFNGYDLVGNDGGVFVFPTGQTTGFFGSLPGLGVHVSDIVGIVATPGGGGYFLVGKDGGVFTFGNAPFLGSLPGIGVTVSNITGIASTPTGKGYYLVGSDGAVYAFGDATSHGSLPGLGVTVSNIVSIVPTPDGGGYWLIGSDGGTFAFGDAASQGSLPGLGVHVNNIVGAVPTG